MQNPETVYNGINYAAVYDYNYYVSNNKDVKNTYGNDDLAVLKHFVEFGMKEGRQANSSFNVSSYKNRYVDLRNAFGKDLKSYYLHYINCGKREGRVATGNVAITTGATVWNGVNYAAVYDYSYYVSKYADIKKAYGNDDLAVLQHFVEFGMKEGRQASAEFNVNYYKSNYSDLAKIYGDNYPYYYMHYINNGKSEGRVASKELYMSIMGNSSTTVNQLMRYYSANAVYPSYYATAGSDAPTLQAFCQIYIEESQAEGVRAEVAFAQAMKETGFLKYGGTVKIEQYNFAGIGSTDQNPKPATFSSVRQGVRAQIQHLKAYASTDALCNPCVDPRFSLVTRGTAPYVEWLGINENPGTIWGIKSDGSWGVLKGVGWASDKNYGYNIKERVNKLLTY